MQILQTGYITLLVSKYPSPSATLPTCKPGPTRPAYSETRLSNRGMGLTVRQGGLLSISKGTQAFALAQTEGDSSVLPMLIKRGNVSTQEVCLSLKGQFGLGFQLSQGRYPAKASSLSPCCLSVPCTCTWMCPPQGGWLPCP